MILPRTKPIALSRNEAIETDVPPSIADAITEMKRESWRIERREKRHTLSLDAMASSPACSSHESHPELRLLRRCNDSELLRALFMLTGIQLRRLLMHAVTQLSIREIARREGCSERAVKYSLARARKRMKEILPEGFPS